MNLLSLIALRILMFPAIYILGFPIWFDLILWIVLIYFYTSKAQLILTSLLVVVISYAINFFDLKTSIEQESEIYWRPHDRYASNDRYEKNLNIDMIQNHGDLYHMDDAKNSKREFVRQERKIKFITDDYGFRNDRFVIKESEIILVGDSFIIGTGNTQEEIPANQLSDISDLKVASIAYVGRPEHYEKFVKQHFNLLNNESKIILFYFEGNDFHEDKNVKLPLDILIRKKYLHMEVNKDRILFRKIYSKKNTFTRKIRTVTHSINRKFIYTDQLSRVGYNKVKNHYIAFLKNYSRRQNETYIFKDQKVLKKIISVFFIPTKARTYSKFTDIKFSDERFIYLKNEYSKHNIPVVNLSYLFMREAENLLREDAFIFWRDDTHWNSSGIKIAMQCVNDFIKLSSNPNSTNEMIINFECK